MNAMREGRFWGHVYDPKTGTGYIRAWIGCLKSREAIRSIANNSKVNGQLAVIFSTRCLMALVLS